MVAGYQTGGKAKHIMPRIIVGQLQLACQCNSPLPFL